MQCLTLEHAAVRPRRVPTLTECPRAVCANILSVLGDAVELYREHGRSFTRVFCESYPSRRGLGQTLRRETRERAIGLLMMTLAKKSMALCTQQAAGAGGMRVEKSILLLRVRSSTQTDRQASFINQQTHKATPIMLAGWIELTVPRRARLASAILDSSNNWFRALPTTALP